MSYARGSSAGFKPPAGPVAGRWAVPVPAGAGRMPGGGRQTKNVYYAAAKVQSRTLQCVFGTSKATRSVPRSCRLHGIVGLSVRHAANCSTHLCKRIRGSWLAARHLSTNSSPSKHSAFTAASPKASAGVVLVRNRFSGGMPLPWSRLAPWAGVLATCSPTASFFCFSAFSFSFFFPWPLINFCSPCFVPCLASALLIPISLSLWCLVPETAPVGFAAHLAAVAFILLLDLPLPCCFSPVWLFSCRVLQPRCL